LDVTESLPDDSEGAQNRRYYAPLITVEHSIGRDIDWSTCFLPVDSEISIYAFLNTLQRVFQPGSDGESNFQLEEARGILPPQ
jgi:hypothetical protein